ncbi:hypothetical protein SEA_CHARGERPOWER_68 [Mycobacterium phage Chargerpower]|nr:hypothetical protein SEA_CHARGERPOWER_68 [Mycobacterium phage Chargerpower]
MRMETPIPLGPIASGTTFEFDYASDTITVNPPPGARVITRVSNTDEQTTIIIKRRWQPGDEL